MYTRALTLHCFCSCTQDGVFQDRSIFKLPAFFISDLTESGKNKQPRFLRTCRKGWCHEEAKWKGQQPWILSVRPIWMVGERRVGRCPPGCTKCNTITPGNPNRSHCGLPGSCVNCSAVIVVVFYAFLREHTCVSGQRKRHSGAQYDEQQLVAVCLSGGLLHQ